MEQIRQVEQTRGDRRWTLTVAPLGTAVVFLSVLVVADMRDTASLVALYAFSLAVPLLSLIAFLTSLREATKLPKWWEANDGRLLLVGYALVAIGIGALLHHVDPILWQVFAGACVAALAAAASALSGRQG